MRKFEAVALEHRKTQGEVALPLRATKTSAGYDFFATEDFSIKPQEKHLMWTDVKCQMEEGDVLLLDVRSSLGVKSDLMMANTIGVVDADYYSNSNNDGNIGICLRNLKPAVEFEGYVYGNIETSVAEREGQIILGHSTDEGVVKRLMELPIPFFRNLTDENTVHIKKGERVCQGIIVNFQSAVNCNSEEERQGGFGSTTK